MNMAVSHVISILRSHGSECEPVLVGVIQYQVSGLFLHISFNFYHFCNFFCQISLKKNILIFQEFLVRERLKLLLVRKLTVLLFFEVSFQTHQVSSLSGVPFDL